MEPEGSSPHSQVPATCPYLQPALSSQYPHILLEVRSFLCEHLVTIYFYGEQLLAPRPTPKLEDHHLSAVRHCLFNIFVSILPYLRPFFHPQPEDAPYRGDREPLITERICTVCFNEEIFAFWGTRKHHRSRPPAFPYPEQDSYFILFFRLRLVLPILPFPTGLPTKTLNASPFFTNVLRSPPITLT